METRTRLLAAAAILVASTGVASAQTFPSIDKSTIQNTAQEKAQDAAEEKAKEIVRDQMTGTGSTPGTPSAPTSGSTSSVPVTSPADAMKGRLPGQ